MNKNESLIAVSVHVNESLDSVANVLIEFKQHTVIQNWKSFTLDFSVNYDNKPKVFDKIKKEITNYKTTTGLYAIFYDEKCQYIGIGRPIYKRLNAHFAASKGKINPKFKKWLNFFANHQNELTIYWLEYDCSANLKQGDKIRSVIENILEQQYRPAFEYNELNENN